MKRGRNCKKVVYGLGTLDIRNTNRALSLLGKKEFTEGQESSNYKKIV